MAHSHALPHAYACLEPMQAIWCPPVLQGDQRQPWRPEQRGQDSWSSLGTDSTNFNVGHRLYFRLVLPCNLYLPPAPGTCKAQRALKPSLKKQSSWRYVPGAGC